MLNQWEAIMLRYNIFDAKQNFSKIIEEINTFNETCVISKSGKEVALITPLTKVKKRKIGLSKGKFTIPDDFDDPLPDETLDDFYNGRL
jgi:antitoxin (DNA-binding transcriptional repressor) of toxin-antitoxin stability system